MYRMFEPRETAQASVLPDEEKVFREGVRRCLAVLSFLSRIMALFLSLSVLFPRSVWLCSSSSCYSLWTLNESVMVPVRVFAVATCVTNLISVLVSFVASFSPFLDRSISFIAFLFSFLSWLIIVSSSSLSAFSLDWAFSVAVATSVSCFISLLLSLRVHATSPLGLSLTWFTSKTMQLFLTSLAFALAFGAMPTLLDATNKSPQAQAGSYLAISFLLFQFICLVLSLCFAVPTNGGLVHAKSIYLGLQTLSVVLACISFALLTNLNVLPMVIPSATAFHDQGFLMGGFLIGALAWSACVMDKTERRRRYPTGLHLFISPYPHVLITVSSGILALSFGSVYIFVEQDGNVSQGVMVAKGCFVTSCILAIMFHAMAVVFLSRPAVASNLVLVSSLSMMDLLLFLCLTSSTVGFSVLMSTTKIASWFSSSCAIVLDILILVFIFVLKVTQQKQLLMGYSSAFAGPAREELGMDPEIRQARQALESEKEALDLLRARAKRAGIFENGASENGSDPHREQMDRMGSTISDSKERTMYSVGSVLDRV